LSQRAISNKHKLKAIKLWNKNFLFHPLTCGNDKCRKVLHGCVENNKVVLKCDCGYTQKFVPKIVYDLYGGKRS
jgi:hypothetical protein